MAYKAMHISELIKGSEVQGWMKMGLALVRGRNPDGSLFRYVPMQARVAATDDLGKFLGWVADNDPALQILTLSVTKMGQHNEIMPSSDTLPAVIAYSTLERLRIISPISYPARIDNRVKFTNRNIFMPYRTATDVRLK